MVSPRIVFTTEKVLSVSVSYCEGKWLRVMAYGPREGSIPLRPRMSRLSKLNGFGKRLVDAIFAFKLDSRGYIFKSWKVRACYRGRCCRARWFNDLLSWIAGNLVFSMILFRWPFVSLLGRYTTDWGLELNQINQRSHFSSHVWPRSETSSSQYCSVLAHRVSGTKQMGHVCMIMDSI